MSPSPSPAKFVQEQQLEWNISQVRADLSLATRILRERGFKSASQWAAEQWMGLVDEQEEEHQADSTATPVLPSQFSNLKSLSDETDPRVACAQTLLDVGQYGHAAAILSQESLVQGSLDVMPPPRAHLSPAALQLRAYALYLAGEARRAQELEQER